MRKIVFALVMSVVLFSCNSSSESATPVQDSTQINLDSTAVDTTCVDTIPVDSTSVDTTFVDPLKK